MGLFLSRKINPPPQVILMGLDFSGKSTLLARLLTGQVMDTSPTLGFNVGTLELNKKTPLTIWDVGGHVNSRPYWNHYLEECKVLVFVVDSSDTARMPEARKALKKVLADGKMQDIPLMVLANKNDLPNAMSIQEVSTHLDLNSYQDQTWEIQACSALSGLGIKQAFASIAKLVKKRLV